MTDFDASSLIGLSSSENDLLDARRANAYRVLIGLEESEPCLALHWMLFGRFEAARKTDGTPASLKPLPVIPFPRRMWAGGWLRWHAPLPLDVRLTRTTRVTQAAVKEGRTGTILFVSFGRDVSTDGGERLVEEQHDYAFLPGDARPGSAKGEPPAFSPDWSRRRQSDSVELFRYSALTANSHRIHYDEPYSREVEHYAGLVVHGPLLATLLMQECARRQGQEPELFRYRAVRPTIVSEGFELIGHALSGHESELAVAGDDGLLRMTATMSFRAQSNARGRGHGRASSSEANEP